MSKEHTRISSPRMTRAVSRGVTRFSLSVWNALCYVTVPSNLRWPSGVSRIKMRIQVGVEVISMCWYCGVWPYVKPLVKRNALHVLHVPAHKLAQLLLLIPCRHLQHLSSSCRSRRLLLLLLSLLLLFSGHCRHCRRRMTPWRRQQLLLRQKQGRRWRLPYEWSCGYKCSHSSSFCWWWWSKEEG